MHDAAHREAEEAVNLAHPLGVALGKVIVHRNDVHAMPRKGVQICGQGFGDGLSFAGFHFRNAALMQHDAAQKLHIEMPLSNGALRRFPHDRKRLRQKVIERFARTEPRLEFRSLCAQGLVRKRMHFRLKAVDALHLRHQLFHPAFARVAKQFINKAHFLSFLCFSGAKPILQQFNFTTPRPA